ncbi:putative drug exporter of the RND superfamily [Promicromonospora umidemergens]|uniref:MMPL family transporter n=1 Tax=Promicromonospora umidemergens TaxID=629679 RepID=A0ABP8WP14_9MICO|nr:MMPL family transporter [Promicromonospora umidemergens]MCP2283277.1 putative drug exporter of the RND superfamily [Promicromonospora umidemergens]
MAETRVRARFSDRLTSRRGAWLSIGIAVLVLVTLFGAFGQATAPTGNDAAPPDSESARVSELLAQFPDADEQSVLVVASRADGGDLTDADMQSLDGLVPVLDEQTGLSTSGPLPSEDGAAAVLIAPVTLGADNAETADVITDLRAELAAHPVSGLDLQVTGGPAFGADVTSAFDGADFTLLAVTVLIVAVLLVLTYRSPVLWLVPLVVVALADRLAGLVTASAGSALDLQFDSGIISVLVFGAGTNYALLLISRYREELLTHEDHRTALAVAWRRTAPAIVASNVTVVLSLLTLVLAVIPGTRGLGITSAVGLVIALVAVLLVLPPVLAVCGRRVFWPFVPRPGIAAGHGRAWRAVAVRVVRRPLVALGAGAVLLAVMGTGLIGTSVGLDQTEKFRVPSESAAGLEVLADHFPPGESQPIFVVANTPGAQDVADVAAGLDGVVRATVVGQTDDGDLSKIMVTGQYAPGTPESLDLVAQLRDQVDTVPGADALVGGAIATDLDARAGNEQDLLLVAPLVLAVSFVVLLVVLRSVVAPVVLLLVNVASAAAAIGAGAWLSRILFDQHALDLQVPLLSFLFLVALGIDYTIFLVHRARTEAAAHGTREAMVRAVAGTGSVITSAGIVLAGVFAALGLLPLVTLGQLGLIVGIGVVVDTLVVRTVIVPALFSLFGDRIWWPRAPRRKDGESAHEHRADHPALVG